jgi:hypothetical protein
VPEGATGLIDVSDGANNANIAKVGFKTSLNFFSKPLLIALFSAAATGSIT